MSEQQAPAPSRLEIILNQCEAAGLGIREAREFDASGKSIPQISTELFRVLRERDHQAGYTFAAAPVGVSLSPREQREYSILDAVRGCVEGRRKGLPFEISDTIAKSMGRQTEGFYMPTSIDAQRRDGEVAPLVRTQLSVGASTKGAEAKFTEYGGFIDLLRNRMVTVNAGASYLGGLQGDLSFVKQTAAGTFSWTNETTNASLSSLTLGTLSSAPHVGQSATSITRQLTRQSSPDIENVVRADLASVHALGIDLAAIAGTGASNQPTGILNTVGIGSEVGGTNGLVPTYDNMVNLQSKVAVANAFDGSLAFVVNPLIASRLMRTQKFSGTNGEAIWTGAMLDGQVCGVRALASMQVPSGQTKGTSTDCSPIIFGDWSSLYVHEWGNMEIIVDAVTAGPTIIKLLSFQMLDVCVRYPQKFAVMADARI